MAVLDTSRVIDALRKPEAYAPEGLAPERIDVTETHVSHLFLTESYVYKVKKPVDLGFVDATSLEKRRRLCEEEVRVNRRFSPAVYLGVLPVTRDGEAIVVNGAGEVIDYAVKMRRLPSERMLDALLARGAVTAADVRRIAVRIAAMHRDAPTSAEIARQGGFDALTDHVEENFGDTERFVGRFIDREAYEDVVVYSRAFLRAYEPLMRERARRGFVRDGHGDLHAAQICLSDGVELIDAIEFDAAYRCGDVGLDAAFLAMDLDHAGRADLSEAFVDKYVQDTGDGRLWELIEFFKCYRAYVRAKVMSIHAEEGLAEDERQGAVQKARSYYALARRYALAALPRPALYLVMGMSGTGKSTIARKIAERWELPHFASDVERKRLAGVAAGEHHRVPYGEGIYAPAFDEAVYRELAGRAGRRLAAGESVVLDATFRRAAFRRWALDTSVAAGADVWAIECVAPSSEAERRLSERESAGTDASDAGVEVYRRQRAEWEPVDEFPAASHLVLTTTATVDELVTSLVTQLFERSLLAEGDRVRRGDRVRSLPRRKPGVTE